MEFLKLRFLKGNDPLHFIVCFYEIGLGCNFAIRKMVGQKAGPTLITQRLWKVTMDYLESLGAITRASLTQTRVELSLKQLFDAIDREEAPTVLWGFLNLAKEYLTDEEMGKLVRNLMRFSYYSATALLSYTIKRMAQLRDEKGNLQAFFRAIVQDTVSYERLSPRVSGVELTQSHY